MIFNSSIIFTILTGTLSPTPQAWDKIKLCCNLLKSLSLILTLYKDPKPVLIPYMGESLLLIFLSK